MFKEILVKLAFLLAIIGIDNVSSAINCYECTVYPRRTANGTQAVQKLCSQFKESKEFEVHCPFSTMCKKRNYRLHLINDEFQETSERGCADQKYDYMNYVQNKWVKEVSIEEPYQEGCIKDSRDGSEYCHCRGDFCNSVSKILPNSKLYSSGIDTMNVIIVFNLVKYFRNMDYL